MMDIVPVVGQDKDGKDDSSEQWSPFTLKIQEPGQLRMITTVVVDSGDSIIQVSGTQAIKPKPRLVPALVFEVNPDAIATQRHFMWLAPSVKLTYPGQIEFRLAYIDEETRNPVFLYEVISTDKKGGSK